MEVIVKVNSTYNNTIVSAIYRGKILKTVSTGSLGFKKAKRSSTLAAQMCGEALGSWLNQVNKNIMIAQKIRKLSQEAQEQSNKEASFEYLILQEAKKKVVASKGNRINTKQKEETKQKELIDLATEKTKDLDKNIFKMHSKYIIQKVSLLIAGVGYGKFGVIRGLSKVGIKIQTISDITAIPHNGCKPPKMRRK